MLDEFVTVFDVAECAFCCLMEVVVDVLADVFCWVVDVGDDGSGFEFGFVEFWDDVERAGCIVLFG